MTRRISFPSAVGKVLTEAGFQRGKGATWTREVGDFKDEIDLQVKNSLSRITANIRVRNQLAASFIDEALPGQRLGAVDPVQEPLGFLVGNLDRSWVRSDPEGPAEMAQAMQAIALPFLDSMHSLEALLARLQRYGPAGSYPWQRMHIVAMLNLMGRPDEAYAVLDGRPKSLSADWAALFEALQSALRQRAGKEKPG